jgi:hypothetical protein
MATRTRLRESPVQLDLYYRKAILVYPPPARGTARNPIRARVDDGLDYFLKDDSSGLPIRAREWICHRLADSAGLPIVEYRPVVDAGSRVLFGSRVVLNGGPGGGLHFNLLAGTLPIAEARTVLASTYAVDIFLGNGDRHANNFIVEPDANTVPRIRVIDFSEATALLDTTGRAMFPGPASNTVRTGRVLRARYGFSTVAAELALDRLGAVTALQMNAILSEMPVDWIAAAAQNELLAWWSSASRADRITIVRNGLFNGTLL